MELLRRGDGQEGYVDVGPAFIADSQRAGLPVISQCALHHPAVASRLRAALNTTSSDTPLNVAVAQSTPTATVIIRLVGAQVVGTPTRRSQLCRTGRTASTSGLPLASARTWRFESWGCG